jgi:ribosomal-protein-alanine N-acetyltransferase
MQLDPPDSLADGAVSLRPLDERDLGAIERALEDTEIQRWFDDRGFSADDLLDRSRLGWQQSESANFAVVDRDRCIGSIWLNIGLSGRASVGYWLLAEARGKGLASHAVRLITRWAFEELGMQRVSLLADPRNEASLRVAERAGFTREGVLRSWAEVNGERVDQVSYSLLPSDVTASGEGRDTTP